ncbi:MAG: SAM-dependent methyltransferase [Pseudomonadota bacterium]
MTDRAPPTPLEDRLALTIKAGGPISVGDFITDALGHPQHGFYTAHEAIGAAGAFTTAPEISQMFGELVGLWLAAEAEPGATLVELGPGRGVMMADILRVAAKRPDFERSLQVRLYEQSARLRLQQSKRLQDATDLDWLLDLNDAPDAPMLAVGNEFLDCLPLRQFQKTERGWRERVVGLGADGRLAFALDNRDVAGDIPPWAEGEPDGAIIEIRPEAEEIVQFFCERLKKRPGRALFIDYGHARSAPGDTLQALRGHERVGPLETPGEADITAHVDFAALARAAIEAGAAVYGPITQGAFLRRLGAAERTERLKARATAEQAKLLDSGLDRLIGAGEMGELFKVICIASPGLPAPAGFVEL